jgi:TPR repeat protein
MALTCVAALAAVGVTASIIQRPSLLLERIATTGIPIASLVSKKAEQRSDANKATFLENAPAAQRSPIAPIQVVAREEPAVSIEAAEPELRSAQRAKLGGAVTDAPVDEASVVPVQPDLPSASVPADELSGSSRPTRQFDPGETSFLLQRSESLIEAGDFASARILYERVAEGGSAQAAFALAATYDPLVLRRFSIKGLAPDIDTARAWYQKAAQLGSSEASRRLELLPSQAQK